MRNGVEAEIKAPARCAVSEEQDSGDRVSPNAAIGALVDTSMQKPHSQRAKSMKLIQKSKFLVRSLAAGTLAFWFTAQILCVVHCNFGGGHGSASSAAQPSCHAANTSQHDSDDSSAPGKAGSSSVCLTLKTALVSADAPAIVPPAHLLSVFASIAVALDSLAEPANDANTRQPKRPERVNTLEVCLGLAYRSLAPPFFG